jgi:hypothetical protein
VFGIALLKVKLAMLLLQLHCYQRVELLQAFMVGMFYSDSTFGEVLRSMMLPVGSIMIAESPVFSVGNNKLRC